MSLQGPGTGAVALVVVVATALAGCVRDAAPPATAPTPPPPRPAPSLSNASAPPAPPADLPAPAADEPAASRGSDRPCTGAFPPDADFPGDLTESFAVASSLWRDVDADPSTVARAIAVAKVFREPVTFEDVSNLTEHRTETCLLTRKIDLDKESVKSTLALGNAERPPVPGELEFVARFESVTRQNVSLDNRVALAVLATGAGSLSFDDVADVDRSTEIVRVVQHERDTPAGQALLAIALGGGDRR